MIGAFGTITDVKNSKGVNNNNAMEENYNSYGREVKKAMVHEGDSDTSCK